MFFCVCKERISWPIAVAKDFPTEILFISADFFTENTENDIISTELGNTWGSGNFGEDVPDVHERRRTLAATPGVRRYFVGVLWRVSGVGRRVPPKFLQAPNGNEFCDILRGSVATEIGHGVPSCKHLNKHNRASIHFKLCTTAQSDPGSCYKCRWCR